MGKSLQDYKVTTKEVKDSFRTITNGQTSDLNIIFNVAIQDIKNFPAKNGLSEDSTYEDYLKAWIKSYNDAINNKPSLRSAKPKSSCDDPSIKELVKNARNLDEQTATEAAKYHNLFMSAENIQGNLLEEYISINIRKYGWVWCAGSTIHAVDFCSSDGKCLLQIKNKNNTENSSSGAIRNGTTITKWYRLGTKRENGKFVPSYKWSELNDIINQHNVTNCKEACCLTEDSYRAFLRKISANNKLIISDE